MFDEVAEARSEPTGWEVPELSTTDQVLSEEDVWSTLFMRVYDEGRTAIENGWLTVDALDEPFIYVGLPSLVFADLICRSLQHPGAGLQLYTGLIVHLCNVPEEFIPFFSALLEAKVLLEGQHEFSGPRAVDLRAHLKRRLLAANSEHVATEMTPPTMSESLWTGESRVVAKIQSVVLQTTQLPFFKANFQDVLESLAEWNASLR